MRYLFKHYKRAARVKSRSAAENLQTSKNFGPYDVKGPVYWNSQPMQASIEHVVLLLTTVSIPGGASMSKLTGPLDHLKIAAPCSADWDQMFSIRRRASTLLLAVQSQRLQFIEYEQARG
jgi:hypothetical protein